MKAEMLHALLETVMDRLDNPLIEFQPIEVELKDPLASERMLKKIGILRTMKCDIQPELYDWLKILPENAILRGIIWLEEADEAEQGSEKPVSILKRKKGEKPPVGPYAKFWEELFLEGIISNPLMMELFLIEPGLADWESKVVKPWQSQGANLVSDVAPELLLTLIRDYYLGVAEPLDETGKKAIELIAEIRLIEEKIKPAYAPNQYIDPTEL